MAEPKDPKDHPLLQYVVQNPEAFAHNLARVVEEGGKAAAAYLAPREAGEKKTALSDEIADVIKTIAQVGEYWLADPQRTVEAQGKLWSGYLDLWDQSLRRMMGEPSRPAVAPDPRDKALSRPGVEREPVLRLPQAGLSPHRALGRRPRRQGRRSGAAHQAQGRVLREADRQRALAVELRADQPRAPAHHLLLERREPGARHAHARRGHPRGRRRPEAAPDEQRAFPRRREPRHHSGQGDRRESDPPAPAVRARRPQRCASGRSCSCRRGSTSSTSSTSTTRSR